MVAALAVVLGMPASKARAGSPEEAIKQFYAAMAAGDAKAMEALCTGKAKMMLPAPDQRLFPVYRAMGQAFVGIAKLEVTGQQATAVVKMKGQGPAQAALAMRRAQVAAMKTSAANKEFMLESLERRLPKMVQQYSQAGLKLVLQKGRWLIQEFETD